MQKQNMSYGLVIAVADVLVVILGVLWLFGFITFWWELIFLPWILVALLSAVAAIAVFVKERRAK